jgi:6-phosphogluconolactonase (cycloisomerase 2 family)
VYAINASNGTLTRVGTTATATGTTPVKMAIDPTGKFAYVANNGSGNVSAYTINNDGTLTAISGSPFPAGSGSSWVTVDPSGLFLYVTNQNDSTMTIYQISSTGALTNGTFVQTSPAPTSVVVTK